MHRSHGKEVRVDLGYTGDRPFVNNASFGAYAEIVQSPQYRDNKNRTMLEMLQQRKKQQEHVGISSLNAAPLAANRTLGGQPHPGCASGFGRGARCRPGVLTPSHTR